WFWPTRCRRSVSGHTSATRLESERWYAKSRLSRQGCWRAGVHKGRKAPFKDGTQQPVVDGERPPLHGIDRIVGKHMLARPYPHGAARLRRKAQRLGQRVGELLGVPRAHQPAGCGLLRHGGGG